MKKAQILRKEGIFLTDWPQLFLLTAVIAKKKGVLTHFFVANFANKCNNIALNEPETRNVKPDY